MVERKTGMAGTVRGANGGRSSLQSLAADLDAMAARALDPRLAMRLQAARRAAVGRLAGPGFTPSSHWINWAPAALALVLVVVTSWSLLVDSGQSLAADLLADALPFAAYLDADFEASIGEGSVQLLEN